MYVFVVEHFACFVLLSAFCLLISLSVIFPDTYLTGCDYICFYESVLLDSPKIFFSLPAVLSWCVLHRICADVSCSTDFLMLILSVSGYGSLCLGPRQICISSALRLYSLCVTRVITIAFSLYVVFGLLCQYTPPPLRCMHAKPGATYVLSGIIWVLSSCWNLNTDPLLQLTTDSNIHLLQILQLLVLSADVNTDLVHISQRWK